MLNEKNIEQRSYYSFFTKYSLMDDYGFFPGLVSRVGKKILPALPDEGSFEYFLLKNKRNIDPVIESIDFTTIENSFIAEELNLSIQALCSKIAAFGLDNDIYSKFKQLKLETNSFEKLLKEMNTLECCSLQDMKDLIILLATIEDSILSLRKYKRTIGVNLHSTVVTRRILEYIERAKELVDLKRNLNSTTRWETLIKEHIIYSKTRYSLRRFIVRHFDLLILEIVEHTSSRGGKYIAENNKEYWRFFYKSLLGGAIISLFALLKVFLSSYEFHSMGYAIIFSINYAICFILVKEIGGIIATKQPAMTASTIAKQIDKKDKLEIFSINETVLVIRKALSSQTISVVGNFIMALFFSCITYKFFELGGMQDSLKIKPDYMIQSVMPSFQLVAYAATAGIFLALSGLMSGYIDNKIIASKITFRIANSKLFFRSKALAKFVGNRGGVIIGNLSLGIFLGSAFLLGYILPFSVDIRHIAFSSSYVGYALMSQSFETAVVIQAFIGIFLIGFTNLIVSFSITLMLALKSRGAKLSFLPRLFLHSLKDFISHPIDYFIIRKNK